MDHHDQDVFDLGLQADLAMLTRSPLERRRILKMGTIGIGMLLAGCASVSAQTRQASSPASVYLPVVVQPATATPTTTPVTTVCVDEIPQETAGPYPADGSNASSQTLNVLTRSGIVRSDIRTSLSTGNTAPGVPLTIELTIVDSNSDCAPLAGYAIYLWHCNRDGNYSLYSSGVTSEDYLRGVQATDSSGKLTFTSIFPACYSGRWPHIHFEIYPSLATATTSSNAVHTTQLALPQSVCSTVYATTGYSASVQNLAQVSLSTDNVFSDGTSLQMATVTGDVTNGFTAQLTVGVAV
jgi:protocatechuate 3,4-dioxygenase beta subunit